MQRAEHNAEGHNIMAILWPMWKIAKAELPNSRAGLQAVQENKGKSNAQLCRPTYRLNSGSVVQSEKNIAFCQISHLITLWCENYHNLHFRY